ncbi:MAG: YbbR-like domain-containing protein [Polyangiaceae bacterium]|nr:YbbR-like domain-containing protein [Polyangiaceae bacterium]MCW5788884.1 YbbR-like domain-containing protein [Polyangiaceae bacterium]
MIRRLLAWLSPAFTENLGLKLIAMTFAMGLFAYQHSREDQQQRTIPVGVVLRLPPDNAKRELMTPIPANIHITVRGSTRSIDRMLTSGIAPVELDLRDGKTSRVSFDSEMFSVPLDVDVGIIDPPSIELDWQDVVTRSIPVQAAITGKTAEGFMVKGDLKVDPTHVTVEGPAALVEVMQFARLSAFDVSGLSEGVYRRRIAIDDPPPRVRYLDPRAPRPGVTVTIVRRVSEQLFTNRPVEVIGVTNGKANPRTVDVTVIGPPEVIRSLKPEQVVPRVDLSTAKDINLAEMKHGSTTLTVELEISDAEVKCQPPRVTVRW